MAMMIAVVMRRNTLTVASIVSSVLRHRPDDIHSKT